MMWRKALLFGDEPAAERIVAASHPRQAKMLGRRVLVEASPTDRVWGIGLSAVDTAAADPARWRGLNLLGFALMRASATLGARRQ